MRYFKTHALLIVALLVGYQLQAQWTAPYANSWIDYNKPYVRIGILKKGLHRVAFSSLPKDFPTGSPEKFQVWHRGKEVSIISTANQEIIFYAVPNDGASDSLLYRPMSSRVNPYFSMYSDESAYFLTVGDRLGKRADVAVRPGDASVPVLTLHREVSTTVFQQEYSLGTKYAINPGFFNSYFELGASRTGTVCKGEEGKEIVVDFKLNDLVRNMQLPVIRLMLHGRSKNDRKFELFIGKNKNALRLAKTLNNSGFGPAECTLEIKAEDMDANQKGMLVIRSVASEPRNWFSLTYYTLDFPQVIKIGSQPTKEFRFDPGADKWSQIPAKDVPYQFRFIDISDSDNPVILKRSGDNLVLPRLTGKKQMVLATTEMTEVSPQNIREVQMTIHDPKPANFIIITTKALLSGAKSYADYRASSTGGSFKPAIFEIQDIYNQFNYGEPSPVAIKRFMSYMLSGGSKDKYLFLIGKSITQNERMVREIPDEVPTIGFPGSDALLVEGIAGGAVNAPVIPVGRLSAVTNQNITDYLQKVKAYEAAAPEESGWRKKVLHLSGGKTTSEIIQLRDYLHALEPAVQKGFFGGTVKSYAKHQPTEEVEPVDIAADLNEGVGMITFFGHGSTIITDPNIGHVRDADRGYHNLNKYPVMYFNGCGVGNVFCNRFNPAPANPKAADRITLSLDWLVAPDRGAIAVIASSYESFVSPGITYLNSLYHHMFENPATANLPIGKIQLAVANDILSKYKDQYNIAYVHQSLLQGDPALRLLTAAEPDYSIGTEDGITLFSDSVNKTIGQSDSLRLTIELANFGRFAKGQVIPLEVVCSGVTGANVRKVNVNAFASQQILKISFPNKKDLKSVKAQIDPGQTLKELTRDNNVAELHVDWNLVKDKNMFSNKSSKDNIPPILTIKTNGRFLKQAELMSSNPSFRISLNDDRVLSPDTTLVDIFIKPCKNDDCDFERITYAGNTIKMQAMGSRELVFDYLTTLGPGKYEMMVDARDLSGNEVTQPYRMYFEIATAEEMQHSLVVSPNPATSYLRFELKAAGLSQLKSVRYVIYNQWGNIIEDNPVEVSDLSSVIEWYWARPDIAAGLYYYKVILLGSEGGITDIKTGKVIMTRE
ncbi:MAG: hypothetical protein J7619_16585 [Dyadobacter sp.]|uniref:putative type IX secretion system sortase PorU2 n=1 Tax=Dyadobacter sp. TaxID=1914288 RepID=UPI001B049B9B|nr:C25 family cysteine peptidase [Dyadobacter sp.]MBO9614323.1 hypothetical protein [Dyadobacter sp.]